MYWKDFMPSLVAFVERRDRSLQPLIGPPLKAEPLYHREAGQPLHSGLMEGKG
jgi:hypothetical protein